MGNLLAYSGISTKIRSMRSQLLSRHDYEQMAQLSSVNEAVDFLIQRPSYARVFYEQEVQSLHRGTVEKLLYFAQYDDFVKIYKFSNQELRGFLKLYFLSFERDFLKSALRNVVMRQDEELGLQALGDFFKRHASFPCERVAEAQTLDELITVLQGSPYHSYLHPLLEQEAQLFDYEAAIDSCIFSVIWKNVKKQFKGDDYQTLCKTYGSQFDLLNLQWIYRSKKYYELDRAEIYRLLLPIHYKLNKDTIQSLVDTVNMEEFKSILQKTYYGKKYVQRLEHDGQSFQDGSYVVEKLYYALLYQIHEREFRSHPFSVAAVHSYLHMKHLEIERLTTVIEGIRYGMPPQTIMDYGKKYVLEVLDN